MPDAAFVPQPVDIHVGQMMRHYRKQAGLTQKDLADALDVSRQQIAKYEAAETSVPANKLFRAAEVLRIYVAQLFLQPDKAMPPRIDDQLMSAVSVVLNSDEGVELLAAFSQISRPQVRKRLVSMAKAVARSTQNISDPGEAVTTTA